MAWTATDLIEQVKIRGQLPDSNGSFTDANLLLLADEAMQMDLFPLLLSTKREYYIWDIDTTIVPNTAGYRIPYRAAGAKLRDLILVDSSGNESSVIEIAEEQSPRFVKGASVWWNNAAYFFKGEKVVLLPTPTQTGYSLRMRFYMRRPRLSTDYGIVSTITAANEIVCLGTAPTGFAVNATMDFMRAKPYFDHLAIDKVVSAKTVNVGVSYSLTFTTDISTELAVGDVVTLQDTSYMIPLPVEFHSLLVTKVTADALRSISDPRWEYEQAVYERNAQKMLDYLAPRNDGETQRIINRSSPLRQGRWNS